MTSLELVQSLLGNNRTMHEAASALDAWLDERLSDPATVARIAEAVRAEPPQIKVSPNILRRKELI